MEVLEAIFSRRSVRRFTGQAVPAELLELLLKAAMAAPSAVNAQPWQFVVIDSREVLEGIAAFHPSGEIVRQAQAAILVCGDESLQTRPNRWIMDCSAATQNILLAAHASGLGAVWLGVHPEPARIDGVRKLIGLPPQVHPLSLVALGYPAETPPPANRFRSDRVRRNHW